MSVNIFFVFKGINKNKYFCLGTFFNRPQGQMLLLFVLVNHWQNTEKRCEKASWITMKTSICLADLIKG